MNNKGKWKITKFWGHNAFDEMGWKYEVAFWGYDGVIDDEEYFDDKEEAELYLEECIKGE